MPRDCADAASWRTRNAIPAMLTVAERAGPEFSPTSRAIVALLVPLVPTTRTQGTLLDARHSHPPIVRIWTTGRPPAALTVAC